MATMNDSYPELDLMIRIKLLSDMEVNTLKTKRRELELKIYSQKAEREHYYNYVDFELKMIEDVNIRRTKTGNKEFKSEIDFAILKRIVELHHIVVANRREDSRFRLSVQMEHYYLRISDYLKALFETAKKVPDVWAVVSMWYFDQESFNDARQYLLRGLEYNSYSELLYKELFTLEVKVAKKQAKLDTYPLYDRAKTVFECILRNVSNTSNIDFVCSLLSIADECDSSYKLQHEMIAQLKIKYPNSENLWHLIAQRAFQGKHYDPHLSSVMVVQLGDSCRLENCLAIYNEAVNKVPTEVMWAYYLNTVLLSNQIAGCRKYSIFKEAFKLSRSTGKMLMREHHLLELIELEEIRDEKEVILIFATNHIPKSELLWCEYLSFCRDQKSDLIEDVFQRGVSALHEKSLSLWQLKLSYHTIKQMSDFDNYSDTMRSIYVNGILNQPKEVAEPLQVSYLEWLVTQVSLCAARKAYLSLVKVTPSVICYNKMLELERSHKTPKHDVIDAILHLGCQEFGKTEVAPWLNLCKHQIEKDPSKLESVYENASSILNPEKFPVFDIQYRLLKLTL